MFAGKDGKLKGDTAGNPAKKRIFAGKDGKLKGDTAGNPANVYSQVKVVN